MPANTGKNKRVMPKGKPWAKGVSGNPKGRPKDGESWAAIIKKVGDMYPIDIIAFIGKDNDLGRMLAKLPQRVQMKYLVTARVFSALMFEPTSGLWKEMMERTEGKVAQPITAEGNFVNKVVIEYVNSETDTAETAHSATDDKDGTEKV
jgi:hypothetical protein